MRSDFASLQMFYPERGPDGQLRLLAFQGFTPQAASFWEWVQPTSTSTCGRALRKTHRVIVPDVDHCRFMAGSEHLAVYRQTGIRAVQSTPLLSRADGRVIGMISTHWRAPRTPGEDDLRQFDILARQAADQIERMQAEEKLRQASDFNETVMTNMAEGLYTVDTHGLVTFVNPAAERLFGWTSAELLGRKMHDLTHHHHPDGSPFPAEECAGFQVLKHGKTLTNHEDVFIRKDGTFFDVVHSSSPLRKDNEIVGLAVVFRDITERKREQAAQARLAAIVDSSDDAIISKDLNGIITSWNRGAEHLFGYSAREAIGRPVTMLIPPDHLNEEPEILERIRRGEAITHYETVRRRKDGALLDISLTVSPLRNAKGQIIGASKVARDISHRKRNEEMLRQAQAQLADRAGQLERLVAERTARLQETVGELEAFSYSVAHDMRAPLRGMQGFARMLLEEHANQLDPQGRNYLERIAGSANRMDILIQDVLNYTRILRADTCLTSVDLDSLVRDIIATYEDWQPPKASIHIEGTLPPVLAHVGFLTQCVSNLIGNAIKFVTPDTIPRIRIWAELRDQEAAPATPRAPSEPEASSPSPGGEGRGEGEPFSLNSQPTTLNHFVRLWFEDNGIGIAPKDYDRVFRMFERLNPVAEFEGTGIGLTIVRKAAERMGGSIGFQSELGKGSKFWVEMKSI